jgi:hypothetical protein
LERRGCSLSASILDVGEAMAMAMAMEAATAQGTM